MGNADVTLTWDDTGVTSGGIPRRPGIDDVGGGRKENRTAPANPNTSPTAQDWNQLSKQLIALAKTTPAIRVSITIVGGVPGLQMSTGSGYDSPTSVLSTDLTIVDNGVGNTTVKWAKGRIPLPGSQPSVCVNGASATAKAAIEPFSDSTHDGFTVDTKDKTDTNVDADFTAWW